MLRRTVLQSLLAASALPQPAKAARKPNFVILFADDLGYGDIGCFGSPDVRTPHIDSIARNGIKFTDGYVSCAVCSPSRAALLTGRHQQRFGHEFNPGPAPREAEINFGLPNTETIAPAYLKAAGYKSAIIGKWHLGIRAGYHPLDRGFDEFFGFLGGANSYITTKTPGAHSVESDESSSKVPEQHAEPIHRGRQTVAETRYLTDAFGDEAVSFIDRHKQQPFLIHLAFNAVHTPLHATSKYLDRYSNIQNPRHRMLAAMTSAMDDAVGRVLGKLRDSGLEKDTLVFFLSDNGCPVITGAGTNAPLNGQKCTYYEGGIRVPFLVQWPGKIPAGKVYSHPVVSRDILPTFLAAAGVTPPANKQFDGVDLMPFLTGKNSQPPHEALFWRGGKGRAVRMGKWKLVQFGDNYSKLYDLSTDIGEKNDLSAQNPKMVQQLLSAWTRWSESMAQPRWPARYRKITINGQELVWEL